MSSIPAPRSPADVGRAACLRASLRHVIARVSQCIVLALAVAALAAPMAHAQFVQGGTLVPGPSASNFPLWGTIASPTAGVTKIDDLKDIATGGNATSNFARLWVSLGTQLGGSTAVSASDTIQYVYLRIDHKGVPEEPTNFNMQLNLGGAPAGRVDHLLTLRPIFSGPNAPVTGRVRIALKRYATDAGGNYPLLGAFTTSAFVSGADIDNIGSPAEGEAIGWEGVATDGFNGFEVRIPAGWFHGDASRLVQPDGSGVSSVVTALFSTGGSFGAVATVRDYFADANGNNLLINVSTTTGAATTVVGTKLAFGTQPAAANAYATLGAFTVLQQNADATTVTAGTATVSLAIASGPVGGAISGTTKRSAANGTATFNDISFAKPGTYTLTATSTGILSATSSSFVVSAVVPPAPAITGITVGNAQLSVTFTAPANDGGSSITTYQYSTNSGTSWTTRASGTTASPLVITGLTNGTTYPVRIRAVNGVGSGAQSNSMNGTPDAPAPPSNTAAPAVTGTTTVGQTLTTSTGTWSGSPTPTYAYQWQRCDAAGSNCANIGGATSSTYTLTSTDAGSTMRAVVTATNASGSATGTSAQTAVVAQAPANTVAPTISGTTVSGQLLTAAPGTWTGTPAPSYGYQWQRCDTSGASCANIASATASTYTLTDPDAGSTIRVVVTGTNAAGSATATAAQTATITAAPSAPANTVAPAITGTTTVGQQLTANTGTWSGFPAPTYGYQWRRCDAAGSNCTDIGGETSASYTLTSSDAGATIRVVVTGTNASGSATGTSAQTGPIALAPANTVLPTISGTTTDGQQLTAAVGTWTGSPAPSYAYDWQRCDASGNACASITGAASSSYTLTSADVGATIRVAVTGTNTAGSASATAAQSAQVIAAPATPANVSAPTITGTATVGQLLTAVGGTWTGTPAPTLAHQWQRCDLAGANCANIAGATTSTYTLASADAAATIRVVETGTNASGSASASSAPTAAVSLAPANTVAPSITGTSMDGQLLASTTGSWTGYPAPALTYQWQRCDAAGASCANISGATGASYTESAADVGKTIRVSVTGTNTAGAATATSTQSAVVAALPTPPVVTPPTSTPTTPPTIAGPPAVGAPLTAEPGTWALPDSTTVQWRRCDANGNDCRDIAGATGRTYTPSDDDAGAMIQVVVTATSGKTQTTVAGPISPAIPSATSRVFAPPPSGAVTPAVSPSDSIPADGSRYAVIRIELFDANGRPITKRAPSDFTITMDGVAVATTVRETSTPGVYELELRSSTVNQVTVRVAVSGVLLKDAPMVRFVQAAANLDIRIAASTETPAIGQTVVFTVDVKNLGPNAATGVEVEQKLSARVRYVSSTATHGSYDATLGTWTLGNLALGETATLKITVTVIK